VTAGVMELVSRGFPEHEVLQKWSYQKFDYFYRSAMRARIRERSEFVADLANAISGLMGKDKKGLSKVFEGFDSQDEELRKWPLR